jgi:integrase/recombinase XerD
VQKYLNEVRPLYENEKSSKALFLTTFGSPFSVEGMGKHIRDYINKAGVEKEGSCHLFRHTMATLMLDNGADIRYIQEILGHAYLSTTQVYTQISIEKLKEIHRATHPAGLGKAKERAEQELLAGIDEATKAELLALLALDK